MNHFSKDSGTTLIEALITTIVFTVVSFAVFAVFNMGSNNWKLMVMRHGMQADGRKALSMLESDLRRTHYTSVSVDPRPERLVTVGSITYERSAVCMAGLADWRAASSYNSSSSRPIWDRYILYYATKETNRQGTTGEDLGSSGRFFRIILKPCSPTPCSAIGQFPYSNLISTIGELDAAGPNIETYLRDNSSLYESWSILADVNYFSANPNTALKVIGLTFQTRKRAALTEQGARGQGYETLQLNLNLAPQNSYYLY